MNKNIILKLDFEKLILKDRERNFKSFEINRNVQKKKFIKKSQKN